MTLQDFGRLPCFLSTYSFSLKVASRVTAQQSEGEAPAEERVAPDLFKNFELNSTMPDKIAFPDWLRSEPQNAEMAAAQVRDFFALHLKP
jgi:hypothetical protein